VDLQEVRTSGKKVYLKKYGGSLPSKVIQIYKKAFKNTRHNLSFLYINI